MSPEPIPVGVVGAGNMGANHVRVYDELPRADLVEVVETDPENADRIRDQYDVKVLGDISDMKKAEAVTVAVPSRLHREAAVSCIEEDLDVLVEKPLALTVKDARAIVRAADEHEAILQVGHIERFNPAVRTLQEILADQDIIAVEAHRLGPFNEHLIEGSVIFDLMIHDLDIIDSIMPGQLEQVEAFGNSSYEGTISHAIGILKYSNNRLASATASHVTHGKTRKLVVTTKEAYITLKYQEQDITVQRRGSEETTSVLSQSGYRTETMTESPFVRTREPLALELESFLECVLDRKTPAVDGNVGTYAVQLASEIQQCIRMNS